MKINKLLFAFCLCFFAAQLATAQPFDVPYYNKGEVVLSAGIGLLPTVGSNVQSELPPVSMNVDYRIAKRASIGAFAAYGSSTFRSDLPEHLVIPRSGETRQYMFGVRGAAHYDFKRTDFYGGLLLGYSREETVTNLSNQGPEDAIPQEQDPVLRSGKMIYTAYIGLNQRVTKRLGVFGELGYGISILKFGVNVKLM
ncbi:MAG: hypothetical protein AAFW73_04730 [Bacteroidota bacterium]